MYYFATKFNSKPLSVISILSIHNVLHCKLTIQYPLHSCHCIMYIPIITRPLITPIIFLVQDHINENTYCIHFILMPIAIICMHCKTFFHCKKGDVTEHKQNHIQDTHSSTFTAQSVDPFLTPHMCSLKPVSSYM